MNSSGVSTLDLRVIEQVLGMDGGYVLDFTDRTFSAFLSEHGVQIDDQRFSVEGTSKAKRFRYFLKDHALLKRLGLIEPRGHGRGAFWRLVRQEPEELRK
jgi:hypothetical protein